MGALSDEARRGIAAVAAWASGTWEEGAAGGPTAWLQVGARRIAIEVAAFRHPAQVAKPRLRFDRVVVRLLDGLRAGLAGVVPERQAAIVTVTAPIRLPGRTESAIVLRVRDCIAKPAAGDIAETIHGNGVRIRIVGGLHASSSRLVGFVHNPGTDTDLLVYLAEALLRWVRPVPEPRWLVLVDDAGRPLAEAYRYICTALPAFERVLLVAGGEVEAIV